MMHPAESPRPDPAGDAGRPLRIAITVDPEYPVPPPAYGGVERIVDMLATGLVRRGHDVTLFANPASTAAGKLTPWPGSASQNRRDTLRNAATLFRAVRQDRFDIIHSNSRIAYLTPLLPFSLPKIMTYHRHITPGAVRLGHALSRGSLRFTAVSKWLNRDVAGIGHWDVVPNGVPLATYAFRTHVPDNAPLIFLGRMQEIKGPHLAIEIARRSGHALILAGNIPEEHQAWFDAVVRPRIDDRQIRYVGPVNDAQKNNLLGAARALLMPILWDEPFGMVMIEAMACGTPVLGLSRGAVPEVVADGVNGFVGEDIPSLTACVGRLAQLDRADCRTSVEKSYSDDAVVEAYIRVYRDAVADRARRAGRA